MHTPITTRPTARTDLDSRAGLLASNVLREGYAAYPMPGGQLATAAEIIFRSMRRMTEDPANIKLFPWEVIKKDDYGKRYYQEVGLIHKTDHGEDKHILQYSDEARHVWQRRGSPVFRYALFFDALSYLESRARAIAEELALGFDQHNATQSTLLKYSGSLVARVRAGTCITRVLRYRKMFTLGHFDRSFATIHWISSHPDLRVLRKSDQTMQSVNECSLDEALVFVGEKCAAAMRGVEGYGTYHDVPPTDNDDRYAVVSFVHPNDLPGDVKWLLMHAKEIEEFEEVIRSRT